MRSLITPDLIANGTMHTYERINARADAHQYHWYITAPGKTYLVATYVPRIDSITLTRPLLYGNPMPWEIAPWYDRVLHAAHDELRMRGARFYDRDGYFA